ncbi:hypothetical protein AB0B12_39345 [Streptomyces sp. NPDC044780]|uniref:hypothetical protein n=1 Tax=unclassified Streptomyces TaxID=2593676 RepID=UPI003408D078
MVIATTVDVGCWLLLAVGEEDGIRKSRTARTSVQVVLEGSCWPHSAAAVRMT